MAEQKPLRALVVDDERLARRALGRLLAEHAPEVEVVGEAAGVEAAAALAEAHRPDVVFLDIQLRGETGFELLPKLEGADAPRVVFVTAFDAYAVRAFEVNALDYLLKPVEPARLAATLDRLRRSAPPEAPKAAPAAFTYDDLLFVESTRGARFVRISEVATIRSAGNYTELHETTGRMHLVAKTLTAWTEELPPRHFVRTHRTALVNVDHVERIERQPGYTYALHVRGLAEPVPVSRRRVAALRRRLRG